MNSYEHDMHIDETALDIEFLEQPNLVMKYSKLCAQANFDMALEQERLLLVKSDLDYKIRSTPLLFGIDASVKITEAVVLGTILQQDEYLEANKKYLTAKYEYETIRGAVSALEHRKSSLENLVRLFGQSYFAGPSVPRELTKEVLQRAQQESSNDNVARSFHRQVPTRRAL
jgi:hypothetical protein